MGAGVVACGREGPSVASVMQMASNSIEAWMTDRGMRVQAWMQNVGQGCGFVSSQKSDDVREDDPWLDVKRLSCIHEACRKKHLGLGDAQAESKCSKVLEMWSTARLRTLPPGDRGTYYINVVAAQEAEKQRAAKAAA